MWILFLITTIIASSTAGYLYLTKNIALKPLRSFAKYYERTEAVPELEFIRQDKFGNKWFAFRNIMQISAKRATDSEFASRWSEFGITQELYVRQMSKAKSLVTKDAIAAGSIIQDLIDRATLAAEEETLKLLALQLFLIEGENPLILTPEFRDKKLKIFAEDEETKGFFLHSAYMSLRDLKQLSEGDLLTYLKEQEIRQVMMKQKRLERLSSNLRTKSTPPLSQPQTNPSQKES
jgi:hypothetical protein